MIEFDRGLLLGVLVGEGHFGGDGKQAQISVRMHTRHKPLLDRLLELAPGSKLYGPYSHGGRDYCQWMARGEALKAVVVILDACDWAEIDPYSFERYQAMKERYRL